MRSDQNLTFSFKEFFRTKEVNWTRPEDGTSHSGHERNHLFLNSEGRQFSDISGVSGLDSDGDGRAFAILDFDRDGWPDLALVNANAPLLQLFRNRMAEFAENVRPAAMIAIRFVGGNASPAPSAEWSNRDGYGALVTVELDETMSLVREHRCGEGMGAQNSATLLVGIGDRKATGRLTVRWPSGVVQELPSVPAGSLVTVHENPADSPAGTPFVVHRYGTRP